MENKKHLDILKNIYHYLNLSVCCEDCSKLDHPIFMNKVEDFHFYCPLCKKEVYVMVDMLWNIGSHYSSHCPKCKELEKKGIVFGRKDTHKTKTHKDNSLMNIT